MYAQKEKPAENKASAVANTVTQKENGGKQGFGFMDNRPEAVVQGKFREMANGSSQIGQFRSSKNHVDKKFQPLATGRNVVLQGRFTGTLGGIFSSLTPVALGATGTYYNTLWNALNNSATAIAVENAGGMANFDPTTNTLNLKFQILKELLSHRGGQALDPNVLADHVALITHELSHAHDSVVLNKELKGEQGANGLDKITNVMMTEVQAWEREARTRQRLLAPGVDDPLWDSWFDLVPLMIVDYAALQGNRNNNEVVSRYYRYLRRELVALDGDLGRMNTWFAANGATVSGEIMRLANALVQARDTI
tara:strand:+ start:253 stop:1179 length:927 start_codon:yes stop_codon:yes gene_type:complete